MPSLIADLDPSTVRRLVEAALAEDVGPADVTTEAVIGPAARARGLLIARERLIVCGLPLAKEVFICLDPEALWVESMAEGGEAPAGAILASITGRARPILSGERTALNFMQRLSGIATLTRLAVTEVAGTRALIFDTRKTTPTLREIEKYAVRVGGGANHRAGLFDALLIKDNHIAVAGGVTEAVRRARAGGHDPVSIEVEVDDLDGVVEALEAGAGRLLLDNFSVEDVAQAVRTIGGRALVEVSGGLRPGRLRPYADAGVDILSLGCLTHSARAVDISLDVEPAS